MWVRFWHRGCCSSGLNPEESRYEWVSDQETNESLEDWADELVPSWQRESEKGYRCGFELVAKLPLEVLEDLLMQWTKKAQHAEGMVKLLTEEKSWWITQTSEPRTAPSTSSTIKETTDE